jgi:hypothetical protein
MMGSSDYDYHISIDATLADATPAVNQISGEYITVDPVSLIISDRDLKYAVVMPFYL